MIRSTVLNLVGLALPLVFAFLCIPILIEEIGSEGFGLLALMWALVSYFGLLDMGLGRALTLRLAVSESRGDRSSSGAIIFTALCVMLAIGLLGAGVLAAFSRPIVAHLDGVPDPAQAAAAVVAMAAAVPFIIVTSGLRGVLEARHQFGIVNAIRIPTGAFTFAGPILSLWLFGPRLDLIGWTLAFGRAIALLPHAYFALRRPGGHFRFDRAELRRLFSLGGWFSASSIIGPLMNYADRFVIGATVSAAAVAFYATPHEMVTKLWIVPGALTAVLFPSFASRIDSGRAERRAIFLRSILALAVLLFPLCAVLAIFAEPLLALWIDPGFAVESAPVLSILAIGIFINCLAHVPHTLLQSSGRARATAVLQLAELPFYLLGLWFATTSFGIIGAASVWTLRIAVDTALIFALSLPLVRDRPK